jgi:hypothetical protein
LAPTRRPGKPEIRLSLALVFNSLLGGGVV